MPTSPIRVLHISHALGLGGTEKVMQSFVTHLPRDRYTPGVFSWQDGPRAAQIRAAGVPLYIATDLYGVLRKFQPQIVHLHRAGWPEPEPLRHIKRAKIPVVLETNIFGRHDPSPSAALMDRTLFVSRFCMNRYERETGITTEEPRYSVLYNPVDTDFFAEHAHPDFSKPVIGRISRPDPGKWSPLALDFLPELVKTFPDLCYRIVGSIAKAEEFVDQHQLAANVEFLPPLETDAQLAAFLSSLSVLVHANDTGESFGLVIAEAMAAGLPVLTHPAKGLRDNAQLELVEHGKTGYIAGTAEEYAQNIARLLTDRDLARTLGENGQKKAQTLFRAQERATQLANIYDQLLELKGYCS